jgi:hypothetical protein
MGPHRESAHLSGRTGQTKRVAVLMNGIVPGRSLASYRFLGAGLRAVIVFIW